MPARRSSRASSTASQTRSFGEGTDRPGLHITLEIVNNQGKYVPNADEPRYLDDRGPRCYPIVDPVGPRVPAGRPVQGRLRDAATDTTDTVPRRGDPADLGVDTSGVRTPDMGVANSPGEQRIVAELLAAQRRQLARRGAGAGARCSSARSTAAPR